MGPDRAAPPGEESLIETVRTVLASRSPAVIGERPEPGYRHAGVLLPLLVDQGEWKVLFTRRTRRVEHHKGQISFPGGAVDREDSTIEDTVLRETCEEIGLTADCIQILGRIDDVLTVASNFIVHPLVGFVKRTDTLAINRAEVAGILKVPLTLFFEVGPPRRTCSVEYEGVVYDTSGFRYGRDVIWGATARMMENFVEIVGDKISLPPEKK